MTQGQIRDKDKPENVPEKSHNHACLSRQGQTRELRDKTRDRISHLPDGEIWENVPECPWEQEQEQGGFALAPCNPVTLSPNLDLARERGK